MMRRVVAAIGALVPTASTAACILLAAPATADDPDCVSPVLDQVDNFNLRDINRRCLLRCGRRRRHATSAGVPGAGVVGIHFPFETSGLATQRFGESYFGVRPTAHDNFGASVAVTSSATPGRARTW